MTLQNYTNIKHECPIIDTHCSCDTCDSDSDEYGNRHCKTCKRSSFYG